MSNRIREAEIFRARTGEYPIDMYINWIRQGALNFCAEYQREYVWGIDEQQAFLRILVSGFPIGSVALAKAPDWDVCDGPYIEVVDGKQRLTTLKMFINNEIPMVLSGEEIYWFEFTRAEQLSFGRPTLSAVILDDATVCDRIAYFVAVNFTGVPQSEEHRLQVLKLQERQHDN
ncbi:DUF262 domain-containing protein [Citrobacter koseri]|uniref:DUF262 domain-containing protein n=1 Tax=Citrobacter koseri TaxID=545 RepID=UPI0035250494